MEGAIPHLPPTSSTATAATVTPSKSRSFSNPASASTPTGTLQPSPTFRERVRQASKDDHAVPTTPSSSRPSRSPTTGIRRPEFLSRGLSLQMPSPARFAQQSRALSPKLDEREIYVQSQALSASPATSLPRHSRGLDFSRASTNLHHSTVAEHPQPPCSSPGPSSPVMTTKGMAMAAAVAVPGRKGSVSSVHMSLDSPGTGPTSGWGASFPHERSAVSSSLGSVNMMGSESEDSDSDADASMGEMEAEDTVFTTPQVHKLQNPNSVATPFGGPQTPGAAVPTWGTGVSFSPAQNSLMRTLGRRRLHKTGGGGGRRRSRKSSSSASNSGYSSLASPRTTSPPPMRSIEGGSGSGGYFTWQSSAAARSRRESLALGTDGLHLSSGNDSGDEASLTAPSTPGVVRRPVTRRGNLLPKTKGFARIRAALAEEAAPVDTEIRRESETIRQVRERDNSVADLDLERPGTATAASSPSLLPAVQESAQEDMFALDSEPSNSSSTTRGLGMNFSLHASRNGAGIEFWNRMDPSLRTPPPPTFGRQSSNLLSDMAVDSPAHPPANSGGDIFTFSRPCPRARSSASDASDAFVLNPSSSSSTAAGANGSSSGMMMNDDMHLRKFKRRREDDSDIATIKRRAVSPGLSAQNSPVLQQSPGQKGDGPAEVWGLPPASVSGTGNGNGAARREDGGRGSMGGSVGGGVAVGKKLGLQGMVDTNDGLMKMSIE